MQLPDILIRGSQLRASHEEYSSPLAKLNGLVHSSRYLSLVEDNSFVHKADITYVLDSLNSLKTTDIKKLMLEARVLKHFHDVD